MAPRLLEMLMDSSEAAHSRIGVETGAVMAMVETSYASGLDRNMTQQVRERLFEDGRAVTADALAKLPV